LQHASEGKLEADLQMEEKNDGTNKSNSIDIDDRGVATVPLDRPHIHKMPLTIPVISE